MAKNIYNEERKNRFSNTQDKLISTIKKNDIEEEDISEDVTRCSIGWFHPKWLQIFTSKKVFIVVYSMTGMLQFALSSYYTGTLSTLEKSFKMSSRMSGIITGSWDIGSLVTNVAFTYIASKGHRMRWVAFGTFIMGLTCFMRILPYIMYGPGEDIKMYTLEYGNSFNNVTVPENANFTGLDIRRTSENCVSNESANSNVVSTAIILFSQLLLGIGSAFYWTCGAAYLDDNVRKNIVPFLLAIVQTIRLFGPTIGFLLSSYALGIYVDPNLHPTITNEDPRWIGAWWLGWYPIGVACLILSVCLSFFPRRLPRAVLRSKHIEMPKKKKSVSDFKESVKRLVKNKIIMFNSFSSVCFCMGLMAYWNFMPKYMETQFHMSASKSNLITGTVGILSNALGIIVSGIVISKLKPSPRVLAGWNVFVEFLDVIGHASYSLFSCAEQNLHGYWNQDKSWNLTMDCNTNSSCGTDIQYTPVCDLQSQMVYYSPCHAGCSYKEIINNTKSYGGCSCVPNNGVVIDGICPMDCSLNIAMFTIIMSILSFTSATGRSANTLISFRCVSEEDKSLSIGITEALLSLLAFTPSPILYGMIVDWTCLVWADDCGTTGNCWVYNGEALRYVFNLSAAGFLLIGTLLDIFVWYYSKGLKIYDEDYEEKDENVLLKNTKNNTNLLNQSEENNTHLNSINGDQILK